LPGVLPVEVVLRREPYLRLLGTELVRSEGSARRPGRSRPTFGTRQWFRPGSLFPGRMTAGRTDENDRTNNREDSGSGPHDAVPPPLGVRTLPATDGEVPPHLSVHRRSHVRCVLLHPTRGGPAMESISGYIQQ